MLFNSYLFILMFLPLTLCGYFLLNRVSQFSYAKYWLLGCSLFFYSWWNILYLPLLLGSIITNFLVAQQLDNWRPQGKDYPPRKRLFTLGLLFNIGLLGYFKYADFFLSNVNQVLEQPIPLLHLALPLAISFFTLQQIAYLVDVYRGFAKERSFTDYCLFVSFFPQLIAGPIVHHKEVLPQFRKEQNQHFSEANFFLGLFVFAMGLFKKVVIADSFAVVATNGFDVATELTMLEAWLVSFSYTFQLYFDFSGYSDMAIGLALMFNIKLPQNFNSPYAATTITQLWQHWHMTLTQFINLYIFRPVLRLMPSLKLHYAMAATIFSMLVSGIWHGAAWTFVVFGLIQGVAMAINQLWHRSRFKLPPLLAWATTFLFFSLSLVIFRATDWATVHKIYSAMFTGDLDLLINKGKLLGWSFGGLIGLWPMAWHTTLVTVAGCVLTLGAIAFVKLAPNSHQLRERFQPTAGWSLLLWFLLLVPLLLIGSPSEFLYFQF